MTTDIFQGMQTTEKQPLLISVIVPVYNTASYLEECLNSLITQTYPHLEIICVNDGSTDSSADILKKYSEQDDRIKIITQLNSGLSSARNAAIEKAAGQVISFVDSDDFVESNMYEEIANAFSDGEVDLAWFGNDTISNDLALKKACDIFFSQPLEGKSSINYGLFGKKTYCVWGKAYRAELIKKYNIRFPDGINYEDLCFNWQYAAVAKTVVHIPQKLYIYRLREDGIMGMTRKSRSCRALDYIRMIDHVWAFYSWNKLLPAKREMYLQFLHRLYKSAMRYAPESLRPRVWIQLERAIHRQKLINLHPTHPIWESMLRDINEYYNSDYESIQQACEQVNLDRSQKEFASKKDLKYARNQIQISLDAIREDVDNRETGYQKKIAAVAQTAERLLQVTEDLRGKEAELRQQGAIQDEKIARHRLEIAELRELLAEQQVTANRQQQEFLQAVYDIKRQYLPIAKAITLLEQIVPEADIFNPLYNKALNKLRRKLLVYRLLSAVTWGRTRSKYARKCHDAKKRIKQLRRSRSQCRTCLYTISQTLSK